MAAVFAWFLQKALVLCNPKALQLPCWIFLPLNLQYALYIILLSPCTLKRKKMTSFKIILCLEQIQHLAFKYVPVHVWIGQEDSSHASDII